MGGRGGEREKEGEIERLRDYKVMEAGKSQGQKTAVPAPASKQEGKRCKSLLLPPFVLSGPQGIGWCPHTMERAIRVTEFTSSKY